MNTLEHAELQAKITKHIKILERAEFISYLAIEFGIGLLIFLLVKFYI